MSPISGQGDLKSACWEVIAAAKRLWPEVDIATVYLVRTKRQHVDLARRAHFTAAQSFAPEGEGDWETRPRSFERLTPLITSEGYALAWSPKENVLVWKEPIELQEGIIEEILELCQ